MARQALGPWYRSSKATWYANVNGKNVSLKVRGEGNALAAKKAWHWLMANCLGEGEPQPLAIASAQSKPQQSLQPDALAKITTVGTIIRRYLSEAESRVKTSTVKVIRGRLNPMLEHFDSVDASAFDDDSVRQWLRARKHLSQSSRHGIIGSIRACWAWALRRGLVQANPMIYLERPACLSRGAKAIISPEAHARLVQSASPAFRPFLILLHETGARPCELAMLTANEVDFANGVGILQQHKTDASGKPRIIMLTELAVSILRNELAKREPNAQGPILRNAKGTAWRRESIAVAMRNAATKAKVKATAYGYRHTFATDALAQGVPEAFVAALLGHSGTTMLHKHYSHLGSNASALRAALAFRTAKPEAQPHGMPQRQGLLEAQSLELLQTTPLPPS